MNLSLLNARLRTALEQRAPDGTEPAAEGIVGATVAGGVFPIIAGGVIGHKLQNALNHRDELKEKIAKLKEELHQKQELINSLHASNEGFKGAVAGIATGAAVQASGLINPALSIGAGAGGANAAWRKVEEARKESENLEKEILRLEGALKAKDEEILRLKAHKPHAAHESIDESTDAQPAESEPAVEGVVGAAVAGGIFPLIAGPVYGHKLEEANKELDEIKEKIKQIKAEIKEKDHAIDKLSSGHATHSHESVEPEAAEEGTQAAVEGIKGAALGLAAGVTALGTNLVLPGAGVGIGAGLAVTARIEIDKARAAKKALEKELIKLEAEAHAKHEEVVRLKGKHASHASKESIEPEAAASLAAVDEHPVVDEATVANPDGGEKVVQVAQNDAPEESAEDALLAVNDASGLIDASMNESNELEEAASGLESILLAIQSEPMGLSQDDARMVDQALESIVGDWNLEFKLCPTIESFGGTHLRQEATHSLEANVTEVLQSILKYVKEMFAKFATLVVNFYFKLTNVSKAVARRAAALNTTVDAIVADQPSKATINVGSLASRVTINGQMPTVAAACGRAMVEVEGALALENDVQVIESSVGAAAARLRGANDESFSATFAEVSKAYLDAAKPPAIFRANGEYFQTDVFPGEIYYVAEQKEGHWRYRVVKTGKESAATTIHTPSKGDLKTLAQRLTRQGITTGQNIEKLAERIKTDNGQRFLSQIEGPSNNLNDENQRAVARFVQQCAEDVKAIHALGKEMLTNSAKSMLAIVRIGEIAAGLYKAPTEAAPAAEEPAKPEEPAAKSAVKASEAAVAKSEAGNAEADTALSDSMANLK